MKKLFLGILMVMMLTLSACSKDTDSVLDDMSLNEIMDKLYEGFSEDELPMFGDYVTVTDENVNWYLGLDKCDFKEAIANEALISSIAHSVVLIRADQGQDIEALKEEIRSHIDTNKWICVGIDPQDLVIENRGDVVLVVVDALGIADKIVTNFENI